ncbi:hypothetical protein [Acetobacter sp.]|uniref:hypothetical protein n=1 Tax=Acetobacter sp. TaxID=440 RepID=UPI0039E9B201
MRYSNILKSTIFITFFPWFSASAQKINVTALTTDSNWVVYQSYSDALLDNHATRATCNIQQLTEDQTVNISTTPERAISHSWLFTFWKKEMIDRTGESVPVQIVTGNEDIDGKIKKLNLSGIQRLNVLRLNLNDNQISLIIPALKQKGIIKILTDKESFNVMGDGFITDANKREFSYCLTQDITEKNQWYSMDPNDYVKK